MWTLYQLQAPVFSIRTGINITPYHFIYVGTALATEEICALLASSAPFKLRNRVVRMANGLTGAFHVTDLPTVVAGERLYMFDPAGAALVSGIGGDKP